MRNNRNDYYSEAIPTEYKKIKVGVKSLDDAVLNLGSIKASLPRHGYANKAMIMTALADNNLEELRNISNFYYNISGIYQRVCNYFAFLYRYDWYVVPDIYGEDVKTYKELPTTGFEKCVVFRKCFINWNLLIFLKYKIHYTILT